MICGHESLLYKKKCTVSLEFGLTTLCPRSYRRLRLAKRASTIE